MPTRGSFLTRLRWWIFLRWQRWTNDPADPGPPNPRGRRALAGRNRRGPLRWALRLALLLVLAVPAIDAAVGLRRAEPGTCRLVAVIDGDSLLVSCPARGMVIAGLYGIDSPELFRPACLAEWRASLGATLALRRLIWPAGRLSFVPRNQDPLAVAAYSDGRSIAERMIGLGRAVRSGEARFCG